jgi:hypothetical protein
VYATVRSYTGSSELADALVENQDEVKRMMSAIDGFRSYYLLRTADGAVSMSVFDDEAGVDESNRVAAAWIRDNLPEIEVGAPSVSAGEVVISA